MPCFLERQIQPIIHSFLDLPLQTLIQILDGRAASTQHYIFIQPSAHINRRALDRIINNLIERGPPILRHELRMEEHLRA